MTGTQERAVTAMRAIGDTVTGAPPLRLPPRTVAARAPRFTRLGRPASRAWRLWLVPAAAATAVVALAVSLVLVRSGAKESALLPGTSSPPAGTSDSASVPPYYVKLPAFGWYSYTPAAPPTSPGGQSALVVGETATGKPLATVPPPHGMTFNVVTGAADDRTFVVGATSYQPGEKTVSTIWSEIWYLLRISPGTAHVAQLTRLPVPSVQNVTGVAISSDGTELAVANQQYSGPTWSSANGRPRLTVWSVVTGKILRFWGKDQGNIAASTPVVGFRPGPFDVSAMATALRWTPDGRELGYAWNGTAIRLLDLSSPVSRYNPDLVLASTKRAPIGAGSTLDGPSFTCEAADGWSLSTGARTFTCAGSFTPASLANQPAPAGGAVCTKATPAHPAFVQQIALSDGAMEISALAVSSGCMPTGARTEGVSLSWANADGSRVIGELDNNPAAQYPTFGIFTKKTFTGLPVMSFTGSVVAW